MPGQVTPYFANLLWSLLLGAATMPDTLYLGLRGDAGEIGTTAAGGYARVAIPRGNFTSSAAAAGVLQIYNASVNRGYGAYAQFPNFTDVPSPNGATHWFLTDAQVGAGNEWASSILDFVRKNAELQMAAAAGSSLLVFGAGAFTSDAGGLTTLQAGDFLVVGNDYTRYGTVQGDCERVQVLQRQATQSSSGQAQTTLTLTAPLALSHAVFTQAFSDGSALSFARGSSLSINPTLSFYSDPFVPSAAGGYTQSVQPPLGGVSNDLNFVLAMLISGQPIFSYYANGQNHYLALAPPKNLYLGLGYAFDTSQSFYTDGCPGEVSSLYYPQSGSAAVQTGYRRRLVQPTVSESTLVIPPQNWAFTYPQKDSGAYYNGRVALCYATHWFLTDTPAAPAPAAGFYSGGASTIYAAGPLDAAAFAAGQSNYYGDGYTQAVTASVTLLAKG